MSIEQAIGGLYAVLTIATIALVIARLQTHRWHGSLVAVAWASLAGRLSIRWFAQQSGVPPWLDQFTKSRITIMTQLYILVTVTLIVVILEWRRT